MLELKLQLFGDGGDGGSAPAGGDAGTPDAVQNNATGVKENPEVVAALEELKQKGAKRNKRQEYILPQKNGARRVADAQAQQEPEEPKLTPDEAFEKLIKGEYKEQFGKRVQSIVQERLKNSKRAEEAINTLAPALPYLYQKYGIEEGDLKALADKITDDDSIYEEAALEKGIPVEVEKAYQQAKKQAEMLEQQAKYRDMEDMYNRHLQGLAEQAENLKSIYPSIDLMEELQNETFAKLTSPEVGISVKDAYELVHHDEIANELMKYSVKKGQEQVSNAVQAGIKRPVENGIGNAGGAIELSDSPRNWSPEIRRQLAEDARRGKKITL